MGAYFSSYATARASILMRAFARSSCICRVIGCAPPYTRLVVRTVRSIISIFYGCRLTRFAGAGAHVELVAVPGGREREEEGSGERAHRAGSGMTC